MTLERGSWCWSRLVVSWLSSRAGDSLGLLRYLSSGMMMCVKVFLKLLSAIVNPIVAHSMLKRPDL